MLILRKQDKFPKEGFPDLWISIRIKEPSHYVDLRTIMETYTNTHTQFKDAKKAAF